MLTEQERNSIVAGFNNIITALDNMHNMIVLFEKKKHFIEKIIAGSYPDSRVDNEFPLQDFLDSKSIIVCLKKEVSKFAEIDNLNNDQYKTFLKYEVTRYNPEKMHLLNRGSISIVFDFLNKNNEQTAFSQENSIAIDYLFSLPGQYLSYIEDLKKLYKSLFIFDKIKNITGNIVMIGANGSGKTTFAKQLNGKLSRNIVILTAQHFLYYHKSDVLSATGNEIKKVQDFQYNEKNRTDDDAYKRLITSDMDNLINALIAQHIDCAMKKYDKDVREESILLKTVRLWEKIIEHRKIKIERTGLSVYFNNVPNYGFNQLSDGEKAVFYYIAHIMLAAPNSYIIVDEPENHLHVSICNQLWDALEKQRADCKFIYLTHDLSFATNRGNSTILWNKEFFPPSRWDCEILPKNDIIPERLIMEMVGSRKNICFCEGNDKSSIDYKLYSVLFLEYTVIPAAGHRNVIDYVNAYNNMPSFITKAFGIIDGDHHLPQQIEKWKNLKIYTLPINEVENILCDENILSKAAETFCAGDGSVDKFKEMFWRHLAEVKTMQATQYVNEFANNRFIDNFLHERNNIDSLIKELKNVTSAEQIQLLYNDTLVKLDNYLKRRDYNAALRFVNFKGRLTKDFACKTIVNNYVNRILDLIKKDDELKKYIIETYFNGIDFI